MRVLHLITKGDVGGAQTHVVQLAGAQQRRGMEVTVIAGTDGWALEHLRDQGVTTIVEASLRHRPGPVADVRSLRRIRSLVRAIQPDVVHCHSSKAGLLGRLAARLERVPAVYTAHGWPFQPAAPFGRRVASRWGERLGARLGGEIICLTQEEIDLAVRAHLCPVGRLHLIPLGLPDDQHRTPVASAGGWVRVVMVARFAPPKDQAGLVDALAPLADLPWRLVLVGDGPLLEQVRSQAERAGVGDRVEFVGAQHDVPAWLARAEVAVLWSRYEGMPLAVLEALRAGLPIVASDLPGVRAILGDSGAGLMATSVDGLSAALRLLLASPELRDTMGRAGRRRFTEAFGLDAMVDAVDDLYRSIRGGRPPG